MNTPTK